MALDGIFLSHIKKEIQDNVLGFRVEKIHQPSKEEIVISLRSKNGQRKLLLSSRACSPRVNFTSVSIENPKSPPMFCMLLRKRLSSAKLIDVKQHELERLLSLEFETVNELGDFEKLTLNVEIMGKYSNVILVDKNGLIIDSLKRVNSEMSSKRLILPGLKYVLPPSQGKTCLFNSSVDEVLKLIFNLPKEQFLDKALLSTIQGVSPIVCREIEYAVGRGSRVSNRELDDAKREVLKEKILEIKCMVTNSTGIPCIILSKLQKPIDITFFEPKQYESLATIKKFDTFSDLLDSFYCEKDSSERMKSKSQDLIKKISTIHERLVRKVSAQHQELIQCSMRDKYKIWADVINANLYNLKKGEKTVYLQNFYDESLPIIKINLDPTLSPVQNAQKYYKKYRKLKTAESILKEEMSRARVDIDYLETVLDELSRVKSEGELQEIKEELSGQGYLKKRRNFKEKKVKCSSPMEEVSSTGFKIFIGKNNKQNDKLTLRMSDKNDLWFHVKDFPGSHVVVSSGGREIDDETIKQAAVLAARNSKANNSSQVAVDYTRIKNVSKPSGAKPGMVIYVKNKTIYVTP